jgi:16S rRNA (uracil1498-N3)-methyltransferase
MHRFFAPALDPGDESVVLPREEAEHLTRVLRLGAGDTVAVFDGRGREYLAKVLSTERRTVRVQLLSHVEPAAEAHVPLTLVQAVLKGDKMDEVIRDAVMLGVAAVQPVVTHRTETTVAMLLRGSRVERWQRVALASVKQSRRATLPEVRTPLTLETYLGDPPPVLRLMLVEPSMADGADTLAVIKRRAVPRDAAVIVGPEGGWTAAECAAAAAAGVELVTLGHRTLRADAVAVAAISILQFLWEEL